MERTNGYDESEIGINLQDLPIHVLFIIFENLDLRSLFVLGSVCKDLYSIINDEYLNHKSFSLLVTNQSSVKIQNKSLKLLSGKDKYKLNFHWRKKYYSENIYLKSKERFRPWLRLDSNNLFISRGSNIFLYKRCAEGIEKKPATIFKGHREDVVRFVVKDGIMISGGNDGKICCWRPKKGKLLFHVNNIIGWNENLYIDFSKKTLASGLSVFGMVKFWSIRENEFKFEKEIQLNARLRSVALSEDSTLCSVGSSGYGASPLKIFDLNRLRSQLLFNSQTSAVAFLTCSDVNLKKNGLEILPGCSLKGEFSISISERFKSGAGIFDIIWESQNVLLTCGYDTYIRMWDLRTGRCVNYWTDPFDNAVSSLASDYNWTIMSGSNVHSRVTLWDKRLASHVHIYHMTRSMLYSPVYSFDFDPTFLFVALNSSLHVLDFSSKSAVPHIL